MFPLLVPSPRSQRRVSQHEGAAQASGFRHWEVRASASPESHNCSGVLHGSFVRPFKGMAFIPYPLFS